MCLKINPIDEFQIAQEDIIVYKFIIPGYVELPKHGAECEFERVCDKTLIKGRISIQNECVYLCSDVANGTPCKEKFGYKNSWATDRKIKSVIIDGKEVLTGYITPYKGKIIKIGETYTSNLGKEGCRIEEGLHSFANIGDAIRDARNHSCAKSYIVECVIPKGSKYYNGMFGDDDAYASDTLKYVEIIKIC